MDCCRQILIIIGKTVWCGKGDLQYSFNTSTMSFRTLKICRYLKAKWKKEREEKNRRRQNALSKGITPIISMLERGKQMMRNAVWQIVKVKCYNCFAAKSYKNRFYLYMKKYAFLKFL